MDSCYNVSLTLNPAVPEIMHWSRLPELYFPINGTAMLYVRSRRIRLHSQDVLLVNAHTMHRLEAFTGHLARLTLDYPSFAAQYGCDPSLRFQCCSADVPEHPGLERLRSAIAHYLYYAAEDAESLNLMPPADSLFTTLVTQFAAEPDPTANGISAHVQKAVAYIADHYQHPLTVRGIAEHCYITEEHLAYLFRRQLEITPSAYLTDLRLDHAVLLLENTQETLTRIAEETGFSAPRSFSAAFRRRFGIGPGQYRQQPPEREPQLRSDTLHTAIRRMIPYLPQSTPPCRTEEFPTVSAAGSGPEFPGDQFRLLSAGALSHLLGSDSRRTLEAVQERLHCTHIMLQAPFDSATLPYVEGNDTVYWDFSRLDTIFDYLLSLDLRPFLGLTSIPDLLYRGDTPLRFGESNCSLPDDLDAWRGLLEQFFSHLRQRYGSEELRRWHCSVWHSQNDMDENGLVTMDAASEEHQAAMFRLFEVSFRAIRAVCPELPVCSPGFEHIDPPQCIDTLHAFLRFCRTAGCVPDEFAFYYSPTHCLPLRPGAAYRDIRVIASPALFSKLLRRIREEITGQLGCEDPAIYTSFSLSPFECDLLNDTPYLAANAAAFLLESIGMVRAVSFASAEAWKLPGQQTEDFCGSEAYFTSTLIPKPHLFALELLFRLNGTILARGDHFIVTRSGAVLQILLFHNQRFDLCFRQDALSKNPLASARNPVPYDVDADEPLWPDPLERYSVLNSDALQISLPLTGLKPGTYCLTERILNRQHGSAFDTWREMGGFPLTQQEETEYLRRICVPLHRRHTVTVSDGTFTLQRTMEPDEVYYAELFADDRRWV